MSEDPNIHQGGLWPTSQQLLLLQAALLDGNRAKEAWFSWRRQINVDDEFDYGSFRLLPLVYKNLQKMSINDDFMPRLKGIYRMAWYENHRMFHDLRPHIQELADAGFDLFFLKGMPLVHLYYGHHALRPMADIDLLVPFSQVHDAMAFLEEKGWIKNSHATDDDLKYRHSMQFRSPKGLELDLHWHVMLECCNDEYDRLFWEQSEQAELDGIQARVLGPTDFLFHTIIHGVRWNEVPPIRWIPDATLILRKDVDRIDWQRLLDCARQVGVTHRLELGLSYLKDNFDLPIPDTVITELRAERITLVERIENSFALRDSARLFSTVHGKIWVVFAEYQRLTRRKSGLPTLKGFSHYLSHRLRLGSRSEFLPMVLAGTGRRFRRSLSRQKR